MNAVVPMASSAAPQAPWGMNEREAAVYELFFRQGMSVTRIGAELGCTRNTVTGLINRMRAKWPALEAERPRVSPIKRLEPGAARKPPKPRVRKARARQPQGQGPAAVNRPPAIRTLPQKRFRTRQEEWAEGLLHAPGSATGTIRKCQWIDSDPKMDPTPCGEDSAPHASYCPGHCVRAYRRQGVAA
jgi:hypothetical protein